MNIETMTIAELKVLAYDLFRQQAVTQQNLQLVEQQIAKLEQVKAPQA